MTLFPRYALQFEIKSEISRYLQMCISSVQTDLFFVEILLFQRSDCTAVCFGNWMAVVLIYPVACLKYVRTTHIT